jgi:hypothetical protein
VALIAKAAFNGKRLKDAEARDRALLEIKLNLLWKMLSREIPKNKIRGRMNFLTYYIHFHQSFFVFDRCFSRSAETKQA